MSSPLVAFDASRVVRSKPSPGAKSRGARLRWCLAAVVAGFGVLAATVTLGAAPPPTILAPYLDLGWVQGHLRNDRDLPGYATIAQREIWTQFPAELRAERIAAAEAVSEDPWPSLTASMLLDGATSGRADSDYQRVGRERSGRLQKLVIAECFENKGRFVPAIVDGIWLTCEQTSWAVMRHLQAQRGGPGLPNADEQTLDIAAAATGQLLAWVSHVLGDRLDAVEPRVRERIAREVDRRVLTPFLERDDYWWTGLNPQTQLNNWTPWIVANTLTCALLLETENARRVALVERGLGMMDRYLATVPTDGACDEGPAYWLHSAGEVLVAFDVLHAATDGAFDPYADPRVAEIGRYLLNAHISGDWFVNFADAPVTLRPDGARLFRFGQRIGDDAMRSFGAWWIQGGDRRVPVWPDNVAQMLVVAGDLAALKRQSPVARHPREVWYPDTQILIARDTVNPDEGLFLAAKGGHNAERHNHNDVGQFIVYLDGAPVLVDPGVETYSNATFGPNRYDIWTMQSAYHNLPTINGEQQANGRAFAARGTTHRFDETGAELSLDLAPAYLPEAQVEHWRRTVRLERGKSVTLQEDYALAARESATTLSLMTPCAPTLRAPGKLALAPFAEATRGAILTYDPAALRLEIELLPLHDKKLREGWGHTLWRLRLTLIATSLTGAYEINLEPDRRR